MRAVERAEAIVLALRHDGLTEDEARASLAEHDAGIRDDVLAEVTAWLVKKAREFRAGGRKADRAQADTVAVMASKIARGAVHPDNVLRLPDPGFFEADRTYRSNGWLFRVLSLDVHPHSGDLHAVGWALNPRTDRWAPASLARFDWEHSEWADVTGEVTP